MSETVRPVPPPPDMLLAASHRVLRPLVRLLMRAGVTFPVFADLLRQLYVEVAVTDLLPEPKDRTDSRVSLVTGIHRKEIRRLRLLPPGTDPIPPAVTIGSQAIARWLTSPGYIQPDGTPLPLPRASEAGGGLSFDSLIESVTTDMRPRTVLNDWLSHGIVTIDETDRVCLNSAAYLPRGNSAEQMFYFGRNLADHIAAAADNVSAPGQAPFLDRSVHYDGLPPETADKLEALARQAAQQAVLDINRAAVTLTEGAEALAQGGARLNFGVYVYREDDASSPEPAA